mmetsp:Transcript_16546/g.42910  ORF Transcript_16546/g.42910 Transcript_16546/m.42910 type:complete len:178 (-) Transcript_16546:141-674(-)
MSTVMSVRSSVVVRGAVRPASGLRSRKAASVRPARFVVRAEAEEPKTEALKAEAASPTPPPQPAPKGVALGDAMAFSGPAPEVINGRLAMLGFAAALGAELSTGQTVGAQFSSIPGPMIFVVSLFTTASLIPLAKQGKKETTFGPFTPGAEMLNGRAAMIGFASLLAYEAFKGSPLF